MHIKSKGKPDGRYQALNGAALVAVDVVLALRWEAEPRLLPPPH